MATLDSVKWSEYWQYKTITTLSDMFPDNYDLSIADFWRQQLSGDYRSVVDLACGNGALSWLANDMLNTDSQQAMITGVDFAAIDPFAILDRQPADFPGVKFLGGTAIESLPFDDGSVDMAISQYGIEYSDLTKTVSELGRVLKPNSKMCFILHDERSDLLKLSTRDLDIYKAILNDIKIHEKFLELDTLFSGARDFTWCEQQPAVKEKMKEIKLLQQIIQFRAKSVQTSSVIDHYLTPMFTAFSSESLHRGLDRKELVLNAKKTLVEYIARIDDLMAAALSGTELKRLITLIGEQGFVVEVNRTLEYRDYKNMGTVIVAQR